MARKQDQSTKTKTGGDDGVVVAPPCTMVIFGAAGDLTKRLVVPALYNLVNAKRLANGFKLVGFDLVSRTTAEWCQGLEDMMNQFVTQGAANSRPITSTRPLGAG